MPPKKKGKAPKKTKEELEEERRLQEEEEARHRAEEEKRLEEERRQREADEAKRREEAARNRTAELERLAAEHEATRLDLEGKAQRLADLLRAQKETREWAKYLACEPRPDAQVEGDLNSFLNSWLLETSTDLDEVTRACDSAHQVIQDLRYVGANAAATNDAAMSAQCAAFVDEIHRLINDKLDLATAHVLQFADEFTDSNSRSEVKMASAENWVKLGLWINLIAKGSRNKRIDFAELGVSVDLPKAIIMQSLALRVTFLPLDQLSPPAAEDVALGGVLSLDLLAIPAPPKRARGWMMREVADAADRIRRLHYPLEGMVASAAMPVKVSVQLPPHVLYPTAPRVGWWDPLAQSWEEDGITEIHLQPETNVLSFNTMRVTHLAVLQQRDRHHRKPQWCLQMSTRTPGLARLALRTEHLPTLRFAVTDAGCRLTAPALPQLRPLQREWLPPGELLVRLAASGLGICPSLDHRLPPTTPTQELPKLKALEDRVIREVVSVVSAYEVSLGDLTREAPGGLGGARWLGAVDNPRQIVFAVRELFWPYVAGTEDDNARRGDVQGGGGDDDDDHSDEDLEDLGDGELGDMSTRHPTRRVAHRRPHPASADFVNVLAEVDDEASGGGVKFRIDQTANPYDTHVHLKRALEDISSPDARDRMENSNVMFEFVLMKLLSLLRLFSHSRPVTTVARGRRGEDRSGALGESSTGSDPSGDPDINQSGDSCEAAATKGLVGADVEAPVEPKVDELGSVESAPGAPSEAAVAL